MPKHDYTPNAVPPQNDN